MPAAVQARIARAEERLAVLATQIAALEAQQAAAVATAPPDSALGRLVRLKGVATTSASVLFDEGLVWRAFRNRRQIGGLLGFAPTKYNSGDSEHDQGISHAGNAHLQAISVQLAWNWVRWQPTSALTRWATLCRAYGTPSKLQATQDFRPGLIYSAPSELMPFVLRSTFVLTEL